LNLIFDLFREGEKERDPGQHQPISFIWSVTIGQNRAREIRRKEKEPYTVPYTARYHTYTRERPQSSSHVNGLGHVE